MKIDSKRQNKSQWKEAINSSLGNIPLLPFYVRRQSLFSDSRYVIADLSKLWLSCSCPLAFLFMPFDFPVHALWLSCSCHLAFLFMPFVLLAPKWFLKVFIFPIFLLSAYLIICYSRNASFALNKISTFLLPKYSQCWWKVTLVGNPMERN
jgi:hypothetical protein